MMSIVKNFSLTVHSGDAKTTRQSSSVSGEEPRLGYGYSELLMKLRTAQE